MHLARLFSVNVISTVGRHRNISAEYVPRLLLAIFLHLCLIFNSFSHPIEELDHDDVMSFDDMAQSDDEVEDESQALFITYRESLSQLLEQCRPLRCIKKTCKSPPKEVIRFLGTAAIVCWVCFRVCFIAVMVSRGFAK